MIRIKSCGCCTLRTGTIMLAIISLIITIDLFILGLYLVISNFSTESDALMNIIAVTLLIIAFIFLIIKSMLIHGVVYEKMRLIKPNIIFDCICLIVSLVALSVFIIFPQFINEIHSFNIELWIVRLSCGISIFVVLCLGGYCCLIPFNYYQKLIDYQDNVQLMVQFAAESPNVISSSQLSIIKP